jgi:S-adenosylmethionine-diacylgycerolhomoserine-N-methlytransferase
MPTLARTLLRRWLSLFDVTPRDELESFLSAIARRTGAGLRFERWLRDYTHYAVLTLPRKLPMP